MMYVRYRSFELNKNVFECTETMIWWFEKLLMGQQIVHLYKSKTCDNCYPYLIIWRYIKGFTWMSNYIYVNHEIICSQYLVNLRYMKGSIQKLVSMNFQHIVKIVEFFFQPDIKWTVLLDLLHVANSHSWLILNSLKYKRLDIL